MTDKINGFTIALDRDIRDDEVAIIRSAILQIKGVLSVENHVVDTADFIATERIRVVTREKLIKIIKDI